MGGWKARRRRRGVDHGGLRRSGGLGGREWGRWVEERGGGVLEPFMVWSLGLGWRRLSVRVPGRFSGTVTDKTGKSPCRMSPGPGRAWGRRGGRIGFAGFSVCLQLEKAVVAALQTSCMLADSALRPLFGNIMSIAVCQQCGSGRGSYSGGSGPL